MFEEKERSHAEMVKRLEESEATSARAAKKLSEKQKTIQEQGNLIKEKEKESSSDGPSAKDKEILPAQENLKKKERAHDVMAKCSGDNWGAINLYCEWAKWEGENDSRASKADRRKRKGG